MAADSTAPVQVLYALRDTQHLVELEFADGITALQAVNDSGLIERFPDILDSDLMLGIFGLEVTHNQLLKPGDRVEISRPLIADPRQMRRDMMSDGKVMGGAVLPSG